MLSSTPLSLLMQWRVGRLGCMVLAADARRCRKVVMQVSKLDGLLLTRLLCRLKPGQP
jgi:hypothetical protein